MEKQLRQIVCDLKLDNLHDIVAIATVTVGSLGCTVYFKHKRAVTLRTILARFVTALFGQMVFQP